MRDPRLLAAIDHAEAELRLCETRAGVLRDLITSARAFGAVSTIVPDAVRAAAGVTAPRASVVAAPPPIVDARPPAAPTPAAREPMAAPPSESMDAKVAFFLLSSVLTSATPQHVGDIMLAITDEFGPFDYDRFTAVLQSLAKEGEIEQVKMAGGQHWRRLAVAPARVSAVEPLRAREDVPVEIPKATQHALFEIFKSGASYDPRELARNLRQKGVDLSPEALAAILDQLAKDKRVERIPLGSTTRYRKRAA